jgi:hypothetical protein
MMDARQVCIQTDKIKPFLSDINNIWTTPKVLEKSRLMFYCMKRLFILSVIFHVEF